MQRNHNKHNMKNKFFAISLALFAIAGCLCAGNYSGTCGTNLSWSLTTSTTSGTLIISGTGAMDDYTSSAGAPWKSYRTLITSVTLPNGITHIGNYAFYGFAKLSSITIPNSVSSIGNYAFYGCSQITSITIPDDVTSIGNHAFSSCSKLTSVIIPNNVTNLGGYMFHNCSALSSVTLPDNIDSIGCYMFYYCSKLTSITIPNSVTRIGESAFQGCSALTFITLPNGVTSIGSYAFANCFGLTNIILPYGITSLEPYIFQSCRSLSSINIPNSVTVIGDWAFTGCNSLTSIIIPNGVTSIGGKAFQECSSLSSITIPNSVTNIGTYAFYGCYSLSSCNIPYGITSLGLCTFMNCSGLKSVTIPNTVTNIGRGSFEGCSKLTHVSIPNSVTNIDLDAFKNCSGLTLVEFSNPTPPSIYSTRCFYNTTCNFLVPCGSKNIYSSALNKNIADSYTINASRIIDFALSYSAYSEDLSLGSITILQEPTCSAPNWNIRADANYGYVFTRWSDGSTSNPRAITLTQDTSITAYFEKCRYSITIGVNSAEYGSVQYPISALYQDIVTITATPNSHYHFSSWNDGNTSNPRTISVTKDINLTAEFEIDKHTISATTTNGHVEGVGSYPYGTYVTITAVPNEGYKFDKWGDGTSFNPTMILVERDMQMEAFFVPVPEDVEAVGADNFSAYTINRTLYINNSGNTFVVVNANSQTIYSGNAQVVSLPAEGIYVVVSNGHATKVIAQ